MTTRGRPPKPTGLHVLHGTFRKDRHGGRAGEPTPAAVERIPSAPKYLSKAGRKEWKRVATELRALGLLTTVDLANLEGYCASYARALAAEEALKDGKLLGLSAQGLTARPEIAIARQAWAEVRRFAAEFGLSPASRTRVRAPEGGKAKPTNAFGALPGGRQRGAS